MHTVKDLFAIYNVGPDDPYKINAYEKNGQNMIDEINATNPKLVLDLGCGKNPYRGHINNLIGIDIVPGTHIIECDLAELPFKDETVDICLALGSINFGDEELITKQLSEVYRVLKKGGVIYFRAMSTTLNDFEDPNNIYYDWTEGQVNHFTKLFNFTLSEFCIMEKQEPDYRIKELGSRGKKRFFWKWAKK